eukprot:8442595-Pyramimonas_sp.AAC.2
MALPATSAEPTAFFVFDSPSAWPGAATAGMAAPPRKAELGPRRGLRAPPGFRGSPSENVESR